MSAKQPTDYIRAYHLARKLAMKRLKEINMLKNELMGTKILLENCQQLISLMSDSAKIQSFIDPARCKKKRKTKK